MRDPLSIQSRNNPRIKATAGLKESKYRKQTGLFIVEGLHEIEIGLQYNYPMVSLFYSEQRKFESLRKKICDSVELFEVSSAIMDKLSLRQNPEGIIAVCRQMPLTGISELTNDNQVLLILDGLEKPGNHGAILRSAAAFGIQNVILNHCKLDPYNPNVIRNSRGHSLSFRHYKDEAETTFTWLQSHQYQSYVASPEATLDVQDLRFDPKSAIILGSEHDGVSEFWKEHASRHFSIPMTSKVDSLNVSVSASIVLFEAFKQRRV